MFQVLFAKLFLILGLPWLLESIHFLVFTNFSAETQIATAFKSSSCKNDAAEIVFRVGSGYNLLRGGFLLLIFGCKKAVWYGIRKRLGLKSDVPVTRKEATRTSRMTLSPVSSTDSQHQ